MTSVGVPVYYRWVSPGAQLAGDQSLLLTSRLTAQLHGAGTERDATAAPLPQKRLPHTNPPN